MWGWRWSNDMGGGYGAGARLEGGNSVGVEGTVRFGGAGDLVEIAWEEAMEGKRVGDSLGIFDSAFGFCWYRGARRSKPVKSRAPNFSRKNGTLLLGFPGCGVNVVWF